MATFLWAMGLFGLRETEGLFSPNSHIYSQMWEVGPKKVTFD